MGIFNVESKFMQVLNRIGALIAVNVMYIISCIPIVTIGAATTALYDTCFRIYQDDDTHLFSGYWTALWKNFRQATLIWLVLLLTLVTLCSSMKLTESMNAPLHWMHLPQCVVLIVILCSGSYLFPMASRFYNTTGNLFRNAPRLALGYFPRTLIMTALNVFPCWLFLNAPLFSIKIFPLFFFVYSAFSAYLNVLLLNKVFQPYIESPEQICD